MNQTAHYHTYNGVDEVEIDTLVPVTPADDALRASTLATQRQLVWSMINDDESDAEEEVFFNALDYIVTDPATFEPHATTNSHVIDNSKPLWRKLTHNLNTILITICMLIGLTFTYLQWRQQAWSNQMSSIQTCLAIEQVSSSAHNSSYCPSALLQEVRGSTLPARREHIQRDLKAPAPSSIGQNILLCWELILIGLAIAMLAFNKGSIYQVIARLTFVTITEQDQSGMMFHVSNHVPRFASTFYEEFGTTISKRRTTGVSNNEYEHHYYVKVQEALAQKMRTRAVLCEVDDSSDPDDSASEWLDTDMDRELQSDDVKTVPHWKTKALLDASLPSQTASGSHQEAGLVDQSHDTLCGTSTLSVGKGLIIREDMSRPKLRHMPSKALSRAKQATPSNNVQNNDPAIEAYIEASQILRQVVCHSASLEEKTKFSIILEAYYDRIFELNGLRPERHLHFELSNKEVQASTTPIDANAEKRNKTIIEWLDATDELSFLTNTISYGPGTAGSTEDPATIEYSL